MRPEVPEPGNVETPDSVAAPDQAGADPTGLGLARALAGDLAARARAAPGRRLSREVLAGRAEAAGLPLAAGAGTSTTRPGARYRPPPRARGRVGGLDSQDPFTGPGADPADPRALGTELDRVLEGVGGLARAAVHALFAQWPDLVGADVAAHSHPTGFADGMVQVSADSSAWATQLRLLGPTICATLDQRLGAGTVTGIVVSGPPARRGGTERSVSVTRGGRETPTGEPRPLSTDLWVPTRTGVARPCGTLADVWRPVRGEEALIRGDHRLGSRKAGTHAAYPHRPRFVGRAPVLRSVAGVPVRAHPRWCADEEVVREH